MNKVRWFALAPLLVALAAACGQQGSGPPPEKSSATSSGTGRGPAAEASPDGCYMNDATTKDGELALLTLSLHHRRPDASAPDKDPLYTSDFPPLAAEIRTLWPTPDNLVITVVNAPPRGGDACMASPTHCLRDRLNEEYGTQLQAEKVLWTEGFPGQMGIIAGRDWIIKRHEAKLYPEWVWKADTAAAAGSLKGDCVDAEIKHFGIFEIQQRSNPDNILRIYSVYVCTGNSYENEGKPKKLRYVMNLATQDRGMRFAPLITGDWNIFVRPDAAPGDVDVGEFTFRRDHDLAFTVQPEVRNRLTWIDDLGANACGKPEGAGVRSFLWNECMLHLTQVNQPWSGGGKLLKPVFHPFWSRNFNGDTCASGRTDFPPMNALVSFKNVCHYAYLTVFRMEELEPPLATKLAGLPLRIDASTLSRDPRCKVVAQHHGSVSGGAGCSVSGPLGFQSPAFTGLRIAVSGFADGDSKLRLTVTGEHRLVDHPSQSPDPGRMGISMHDESLELPPGAFCRQVVVSSLQERKLEVRAAVEAAPHALRVDDITVTDLGGDPCDPCKRTCAAGSCGGSDGCGGRCGCPTGTVCRDGKCDSEPCKCLDKCGCNECGRKCPCPSGKACFEGGQCLPLSTCKAPNMYCARANQCLPLGKCLEIKQSSCGPR